MALNILYSGLFTGASYEDVFRQMWGWMDVYKSRMNLSLLAEGANGSAAAYYLFDGEPIGVRLSRDEENVTLTVAYKMAASTSSGGTVSASCSALSTDSLAIGRRTQDDGTTLYCMGVWYARTRERGLLMGLYTDEEHRRVSPCPVYLGFTENAFLHEKLVYGVALNYGRSGVATVSDEAVNGYLYEMAGGVAVIRGEGGIVNEGADRTVYTVKPLLPDTRPDTYTNSDGGTGSGSPSSVPDRNTIRLMPLCGCISGAWGQIFPMDRLYLSWYSATTQPPLLRGIEVPCEGGSGTFVHVAANEHGGIAVLA